MDAAAWIGLYKLGRLALLGVVLGALALRLFARSRREELEAPALRMLEDER
jgi:hypothetical protein